MKKNLLKIILFFALGFLLTNNFNYARDVKLKIDRVAAKINDTELKTSDLIQRLISKHGYAILENMIVEEIVTMELKKQKLKAVSIKEVDLYIKRILKQLRLTQGGFASIQTFLKNQKITLADFRKKIRREIGIQRILGNTILVTEKEMKDHYEKYKGIYIEPPAKQVVNITIFHRNSPAPTDLRNDISKSEALKLANEIKVAWEKDPKHIDMLWKSKKYFIRGYDRRFGVPLKMKDKKNFIDVFKTPNNQITPVIQDLNGFQIYKVVKDLAGRTLPFTEVQSQIHDKLKSKKVRESLIAGAFDKIKKQYNIQRLLNLKAEK
ncbi:MAG: hypothetical protein COA79_10215 [Planctomycetota bacterium]|nr:MAG: hypothetical protein COA79_10215 [Planctomycetota bacterium]